MTLVKIKKIGEGAQGTAHIVEDKRTGNQYVAKKTKNMIDTFRGRPYEAYILDELLPRHPNIIHLINYDYEPGDWRIKEEFDAIYDLCRGGNLSSVVDVHEGGYVPESFIWHVFDQLADALTLLHHGRNCHARTDPGEVYRGAKAVVHRDIKPDNIFLKTGYRKGMDRRDYPTIVLGDFGLATTEMYPSCGGTTQYLAPERESSREGDVWALGCVIHFLIFGLPPSMLPYARRKVPEHWEGDPRTRRMGYLPKFYSDKLDDVLMECLQRSPRERIDSWSLLKRIRRDAPLGMVRRDAPLDRRGAPLGRRDPPLGRRDAPLDKRDAPLDRRDASLGRR